MSNTEDASEVDLTILSRDIGSPMNLLTDAEIIEAAARGYFFRGQDDYQERQVRQASYELTLGRARTLNDIELENHTDNSQDATTLRSLPAYFAEQNGSKWLFINPMQSCTLYTSEQIFLPNNVVCRVNARGQLFESGIILESTYVDPGFDGEIHLMAYNSTERLVKLPLNMAIARLEFMKLSKPVKDPHGGRKAIHSPEPSLEVTPWPLSIGNRREEIQRARNFRDKVNRELSIDTLILAAEKTDRDLQAIEDRSEINRVFIISLAILCLLLYLRSSSFMTTKIRDLAADELTLGDILNHPFMALLIIAFVPIVKTIISASFRGMLKRTIKRALKDDD